MMQAIQPGAVYGVETSGGRITLVRAQKRRGRASQDVLARDIDPANDAAWPALAARIAREQQEGAALVAGIVLVQDSFMRPLEVPFSSPAKARAVLPSRLDVELPVPVEQCHYSFSNLTRLTGRAGIRAIAVAVPRERMDATMRGMNAIALDPEWMEQEAVLLWRMAAAEAESIDAPESRVVLYLAKDRVVAVAGREGLPISSFSARTAWGGDEVSRSKLLARLRPFLAGLTREPGMEQPRYLVAGALARENGDSLRLAIGVEAGAWRVLPHPETGLVRALAESVLLGGAWSGNLRTGDAMHPNLERMRQKQTRRAAAWIAVSAIALLCAAFIASWQVRSSHRQWQERVQQSARAITGLPSVPRGQEVFLARQHAAEAQTSGQLVDAWLGPGAYPLFSRLLRLAHLREIEVETLSVGTEQVLLRGLAADASEAGHVARFLEQEGWKAVVETGSSSEQGQTFFTVKGEAGP